MSLIQLLKFKKMGNEALQNASFPNRNEGKSCLWALFIKEFFGKLRSRISQEKQEIQKPMISYLKALVFGYLELICKKMA